MKLKEINRTAIQCWSPAQHHPVYLAAGTSAQQLDASFSTNASLEIFELDLADSSLNMKSCGTFSSSHRYHKLVWGPHGIDAQGPPSGVIIAGGENGDVILYDPAQIMAGSSDVIIAQSDMHTGPVRALDINPFQTNLVASGGNESQIYIWDLNNFGSPMTPGPKTQPLEDISCVAWNRQVQHILASASPSGRASVWDLRKNDLIIKVSDHSNRMHCSGLAWNPEVATQLVLASEDDRMPVIQMWDLRFATSPLKILENHTRGVLAIAWSLADPELLLSCGKDNRILCWNPNTAEVLYELPTSTQWCFDIQWCPRNPAVLSAAAFDGHIGIYSIMGGGAQAQSQQQAEQITNSFGNMDPFGTGQTLPPLQLPQPTAPPATINPLKKPPKWIRRPVGASFAFGGKLVSLENIKTAPQQPTTHVVHVSQVVTETDFLARSNQLQETLNAGSFVDFCQTKIDTAQNEFEKTVWSFLKVNFEDDSRGKYLELLGYKKEELALKISAALEGEPVQPEPAPAPASITEPEPSAEPELAVQPEISLSPSEPVAELAPEPVAEPTPEPVAELAPEPVAELAAEPVVDLAPEPVAELAAEPAVDLAPEPVAELAAEPVVELVPEPVAQLVPEPVAELALEPVAEQVSEPAVEMVPVPAVEPFPTSVAELIPEPAAELIPEPVVELVPQPVAMVDPVLDPALQLQSTLLPSSDLTAPSAPFLQPMLGLQSPPLLDLSADPGSAFAPPEPQPDPSLVIPYQLQPLDAFDLQPPVNLDPASVFDQISLQPVPQPDLLDATPEVNPLLPVPELALTNSIDLQQTTAFDPTSSLNLQPVAMDFTAYPSLQPAAGAALCPDDIPPEAAFDFIAAANLQPVVEEVAPPAEPEVLAAATPEAEALTGAPEASADQFLPEQEDIPLEEEEIAPTEAESDPVEEEEAPAPEEEEAPVEEEAPAPTKEGIDLNISQDVDGLITQALLTGDFEGAVELCLFDNRMADSIILAIAGGADLLEKTQKKYFTKTHSKITKLISAVVMKDWHDILQTCDLQNWKEALAAVMTYAQPDEFSPLCDMLGGRLEASEEDQLQAQACLCYICAGNVEKLVSCWTKAQHGHCPLSLQDLVEKVVVLRRAVEQTQGSGPSVGMLLAEKMSQYAGLLASQGSLATAIAYLPENTNQAAVQQLRDRLSRALGQLPAAPAAPAPAPAPVPVAEPQPPVVAQLQAPQAQPTAPLPHQPYVPSQPAVAPQPAEAPVPAPVPAPQPPQYYQPVEPTPPMHGMLAPGASAAPPPSATAPAYMYSHQYQPYPQVNQYPPGPGGAPIYQPLQYSSSAAPPPLPHSYPPPVAATDSAPPPAPAPGFLSQYMQPAPPQPALYPGPPPIGHTMPSSAPSHPPFIPTDSSSSFAAPPPLSSGMPFQHGGPGSPVSYMPPPPPPTGASGPQNGWNDPPALSGLPKKKKIAANYTPPAPITAPIMAPLGGEPQAQPMPSMPPQPLAQGQPGAQVPYSGMHQQPLAAPPMNPALPKTSGEGPPGAPTGDVIHQPMQTIPAEKIMKKPIPDEHMVLKTTFEGLIQKCLLAANDPQTKRKLDDANKRLETLYDKLREQTLSPAIVGGLHNMARCIESRAYADSLNIHTHIVTSSNFSEISGFMPVLKVVLTQANKLGV